MSQNPNTMNFLPEDYVEKRQAARSAVVFVGLLFVVVVAIFATFMVKKWKSDAVFVEQSKVNAQFEEAEKKIAEANEIDRQKATMVAKAELATTLMERVPRNVLLRQLTELQPPNVHMVNLELTTKEIQQAAAPLSEIEKARRQQEGLPPETPKPPVREVTVNLISMALTDADVAKYIGALNKCPLLKDVNLLFSEEYKVNREGKEGPVKNIRKFHVEMKIDPKADLRQIDTLSRL